MGHSSPEKKVDEGAGKRLYPHLVDECEVAWTAMAEMGKSLIQHLHRSNEQATEVPKRPWC